MEFIFEALLDTIKLLPFLFISFILMELIEHKLTNKKKLKKINKFGPLAGSILGLIPQCGFSIVASDLYKKKYTKNYHCLSDWYQSILDL